MSAGSRHLLSLPVRSVEKLWLSSPPPSHLKNTSKSSCSSSSSFPCSLFGGGSLCMRPRGAKGSMPLKPVRCGFGVKYFGFLHIRGCFFHLYFFLRGSRT